MNNPKQLELNFDKELPVSRAELLNVIEAYCEAAGKNMLLKNHYRTFAISKDKLEQALDKLYDTPRNKV